MTEYLSLKPYKVHFDQKLHGEDFQDRMEMCHTLLPMWRNREIQENVSSSDEATIYVNGFLNKHKIRYWCKTNPHGTLETVMKSPKLSVWCTLSKNQLIGPFFFADDTVNTKNYLPMLQSFFLPAMKRLSKARSIAFQQDGAPANFTRDVRDFLDQNFRNRWMGRSDSIRWRHSIFSLEA